MPVIYSLLATQVWLNRQSIVLLFIGGGFKNEIQGQDLIRINQI